MSKHPAITFLEKKHSRHKHPINAELACTCNFHNCEVLELLEAHQKFQNIFSSVRKDYIKMIDDYQLRMTKIRWQLKSIEGELETYAKDQ